jgi:hypothetical protein
MNETQTNEYLVEEYQVTKSTINALSISVKRFYKNVSFDKYDRLIEKYFLIGLIYCLSHYL